MNYTIEFISCNARPTRTFSLCVLDNIDKFRLVHLSCNKTSSRRVAQEVNMNDNHPSIYHFDLSA